MFDLDKVTGSGERAARDFLAETFFSDFDRHRKSQQTEVGGAAMAKNQATRRLRKLLNGERAGVMEYLKSLSPSGVELEIMSLTTFEFGNETTAPNHDVSV